MCIKSYSQMREAIALSLGESEFYGIVKAATMDLGTKGLLQGAARERRGAGEHGLKCGNFNARSRQSSTY